MNYEMLFDLIGIFSLIFGLPIVIYLITEWSLKRKFKNTEEARQERMDAGKDKLSDLFNGNTEFCPKCWTHEYFWTGGGSWSPDRCPNHRDSDDAILWKNMRRHQKRHAAIEFTIGWYRKYGVHYFNKKQLKLLGDIK